MPDEKLEVYKVGKDSMKKALELFSDAKKSKKRKKTDGDDKLHKYSQYCNSVINHSKRKYKALAFLPSFALIEMRLCLMKHDWINLQRLFPMILQLSSDRESIVWRYALTILLHSPMSNETHLEGFLNSCIGCHIDNFKYVLGQLLTLKKDEKKR